MALNESDVSELLAALRADEMTDTVRASSEWVLQQLIEAEATAVIGPARTSALTRVWRSAAGIVKALVSSPCSPLLSASR